MTLSPETSSESLDELLSDEDSARVETPSAMTAVMAAQYVRRQFPAVPRWICWLMRPDPVEIYLQQVVGTTFADSGTVGPWRWEKVPSAHPCLSFWDGRRPDKKNLCAHWVGVLRWVHARGDEFLLFAYLNHKGSLNSEYLVSTNDRALLRQFAKDVRKFVGGTPRRDSCVITVHGAPDMVLPMASRESLYLDENLIGDIESQVHSFFANRNLYRDLDIPYKRGFLFTGAPGTGKTMMIRRLARECHRRFKIEITYLAIKETTDADDIAMLFSCGSEKRPRMLILEDLDSLTRETRIPRSVLLNQLDGLAPRSGVLVIGTTNHPDAIDPALIHRPSRFDRVWMFPLPDEALRLKWLKSTFTDIDTRTLKQLATQTKGWTFAYMNELRVTASLLTVKYGLPKVTPEVLGSTFGLLQTQFEVAKSGYKDNPDYTSVGFSPLANNPKDRLPDLLRPAATR